MNSMIEFAKNKRTTTYFRDEAILEIRIAYRIMEYLAPDSTFPPKTEPIIKNLILVGEFLHAYECIMEEFDADLGCSAGMERLSVDAIELMKYLLPLYKKDCMTKKEKRRLELITELNELDEPPD